MCVPSMTDQVVALADAYADQFVASLSATEMGQVFTTREILRKAVVGMLVSFLTETLLTVEHERITELVPTEGSSVKTTATL